MAAPVTTLTTPCSALPPNRALAGPRTTSMAAACSVFISNRLLTLQNPAGRIGMPFSSSRNSPHAPGPASTPERIAVRCSWPEPREIHTPGTRTKTSCGWLARTSSMSSPATVETLPTTPWLSATEASARTTISSIAASARWPNAAANDNSATKPQRGNVLSRMSAQAPSSPAQNSRTASKGASATSNWSSNTIVARRAGS